MKKIFALTLGLTVLMSLFSCSKEDFDSKYYNPSKTTTVTCDKLLSGVLYVGCEQYKSFGYNTYWRLYTWEGFFAQLTQQRGFNNNSGGVYFIQDGWATDRWNNFYETLAQFRLLQDTYEKSADQETDGIFVACAEVFVLDQLSQLVDVFGPVPYSKAGYLGITGDLASSYPAYDNDEELYGMMLDRLGELYNTINGYASSPSAIVSAKMKAQDFLNKGDLDKWLRYANSLRLRLATPVAAQGSLTGKAKTVIAECAGRKLADSMENGIFGAVDVLTNNSGMFWEWYRDGFAGDGKNVTASQKLIDAMQITGSDDPRLKVIYNPNAAGKFVGKHVGEKKADQDAADTKGWSDRVYATLDSVTFLTNSCMKNPVVSPAETWFLLAEARQAYGLSGSAEQAFKNGVRQSILEWYDRNMTSKAHNMNPFTHFKATSVPSDSEIEAYASAVWGKYSNKLEAIMTQKWVHMGLMNAHESWTDIRRTGFPALTYPEDSQSQTNRTIIQRVLYPIVEKTNNKANYEANTLKDDNSTVLFWAKELK